jgi:molybdopterin-guanine dinucleotide biosynthesis protein B
LVRAIAVVGYKGAGKTKVVEGLVRELSERGYRVATVKHISKRGFSIDRSGKDTWRHAEAGAKTIVSLAPRELAVIEKRSAKLDEILRRLEEFDFVIVEGFKGSKDLAKIVVATKPTHVHELADEFTIASIGARRNDLPFFGFGEIKKLTDLVEQKTPPVLPEIDCRHCGYKGCKEFALAVLAGEQAWNSCRALGGRVTLIVDGKHIFLNPFLQELVARVIDGLVSSLKGAEGERIELKVIKHAEAKSKTPLG